MKTFRRLCAVFVLTLAFVLPAFAGTISTGVVAPPPPDSQASAQGNMSTGVAGTISTGATAVDPATEIVLSLLQSLLALF